MLFKKILSSDEKGGLQIIITVNKAPRMPILLNIMLLSIFFNLIKVYCDLLYIYISLKN